MTKTTETAHPVDLHVGAKVRLRRKFLGMSQEQLADALGLTFQQIQKYERGANRISCSKLFEICRAVNVEPAFFFEGLELEPSAEVPEDDTAALLAFFTLHGGLELARAFQRLTTTQRGSLLNIAVSIADTAQAVTAERLAA